MGGYCYLNNVAIVAQACLDQGAKRVAILDVDYHHGNGTQSIFYNRADVLVANIHGCPSFEYPHFLGYADETGEGAGEGFNLNLPLAAGSAWDVWGAALETACRRIATTRRTWCWYRSVSTPTRTIRSPVSSWTAPTTCAWANASPRWANRRCL